MSPLSTPAHMYFALLCSGRIGSRAGVIVITTTITTGTGTTGSGWGIVRR